MRSRSVISQPQHDIRLRDAYSDAKTLWMPNNPSVNLADNSPVSIVGTAPTIAPWEQGVASRATSYTVESRYLVRTGNPATEDWPGVTIIAVLDLDYNAMSNNAFPSVTAFRGGSTVAGGWNLTVERSSTYRDIFFRAGNSNTWLGAINGSTTGIFPHMDMGVSCIVASWDRVDMAIVTACPERGYVGYQQRGHSVAWVNAACEELIGGYPWSGNNRTMQQRLLLTAILPRGINQDEMLALAENPWGVFDDRRSIFLPAWRQDGDGVTGSLSITDALDTVGLAGNSVVSGLLSVIGASDTITATARSVSKGSVSYNDTGDTKSVTGASVSLGSISIGGSDDTFYVSSDTVAGNIHMGESTDTVGLSGASVSSDSIDMVDTTDSISIQGGYVSKGSLAIVDTQDRIRLRSEEQVLFDLWLNDIVRAALVDNDLSLQYNDGLVEFFVRETGLSPSLSFNDLLHAYLVQATGLDRTLALNDLIKGYSLL